MANWSELHEDMIALIVNQLVDVEDIARFSCVCKPWNSVVINQKKQRLSRGSAPWLMLAKRVNDQIGDDGKIRTCYSLSTKHLFKLELPEAQRRRCWGTSYGWIVTMGVDLNINLLHPITRVQISLPSQPTFPRQYTHRITPKEICRIYLHKIALASNPYFWGTNNNTTITPPTPESSLVMALYGEYCELAIASPGDKTWRSVECPDEKTNDDIIFFDGHFYAISYKGILLLCEDLCTTQPKTIPIASPPDESICVNRFYLVNLCGDLHLVERSSPRIENEVGHDLHRYHYETRCFYIYKFDFLTKKWTEIEDLGDNALFVGNNISFAISTSVFPEFKVNCIYFTDDHVSNYKTRFCDTGIYDITKNAIEHLNVDNDVLSKFSRPCFFMPNI
ncbi:F-box skip23-like protein [Thalictrum thalictroides]|uniref:F-box skip23-like protein n=1 Tax=Thalictrum thalictroides TaxID=46969 RepID=A0A7J6WBH0_THATH|nr:F-box skip23-like protein [Thalictrum thalictroides]